jgi:hypothetical protein
VLVVKLFPWIPEFIVNFLTKTALVQSTTWVKRESELEEKRLAALKVASVAHQSSGRCWMRINGGFCADLKAKSRELLSEVERTHRNTWATLSPKLSNIFRKGGM